MIFVRERFLFCPKKEYPWMQAYASTPFVSVDKTGELEVFFTSRGSDQRSYIGRLKTSMENGCENLQIDSDPVLSPGQEGEFDGDGVLVGAVGGSEACRVLYYLGWKNELDVPWSNFIGCAFEDEKGVFEKSVSNPVVSKSETDPHSLTYPWYLECGDDQYLFYGSSSRWQRNLKDSIHSIKMAILSGDGTWNSCRSFLIEPDRELGEWALTRPVVWRDEESEVFRMLFSVRTTNYQIHHAVSCDLQTWERQGAVKFQGDSGSWDREEQAYASVFFLKGHLWAIYSGNGCGKSGMGIARVEIDNE